MSWEGGRLFLPKSTKGSKRLDRHGKGPLIDVLMRQRGCARADHISCQKFLRVGFSFWREASHGMVLSSPTGPNEACYYLCVKGWM